MKKMYIVIKKDAAKLYSALCVHSRKCPVNNEWYAILEKVQGRKIEVETKFLFKDQYNTVPIKGVSKDGLRIMDESVEEVINDVRKDFKRCNWCGKVVDIKAEVCECGKKEYFEDFSRAYFLNKK